MTRVRIAYIPSSHLDLYWLGNYKTCLARGADLIKQYLDRCLATDDETFLLESVVFAEYFLHCYPDYREVLIRLVAQGRVEVGAAYVDRWEHLILGESHIRNILLGKRWCRTVLGIDNHMVTHPDLPGLIPQIPQIYAQAGIRYYVTSRKVYPHGAVWRYRAPDGSQLLMLNWPRHYVYVPLDLADIPSELQAALWVEPLDLEASSACFPLGTIPLSGSAGDLADRQTFRERYGSMLEECVAANRARYPDLDFTYTTPSRLLAAYDGMPEVPLERGEVPSVWGVAADEEVTFFQRDRENEALLLTAETVATVAEHLGLQWQPAAASSWQGTFFDAAFFGRKDPIVHGEEFDALWRMHVFTQDHNGGGQEGALSTFQKRVMQDRCAAYNREIIDTGMQQLARQVAARGELLLVFNPHGHEWSGPITVDFPRAKWDEGLRVLDHSGQALPAQAGPACSHSVQVHIDVAAVPAVGYHAYSLGRPLGAEATPRIRVESTSTSLHLHSDALEVAMDREHGGITTLSDIKRGEQWGAVGVGRLQAWTEHGNDVTLRLNPTQTPEDDCLLGIDEPEIGPLFTRVRLHKSLHRTLIEQTVTLWERTARVDLEVRVFWWGAPNLQLRFGLPGVPNAVDLAYGTPFYASSWTDVLPSASPRNRDEVLPEDYLHYREVQGWLHLKGAGGGLTICTRHPGFYHDLRDGLSAVLLRSVPSCGDTRLYWANAGQQVYRFTLLPGERTWQECQAPLLGASCLKPPVSRLTEAVGTGQMPVAQSFLNVAGDGVVLSSLAPAVSGRGAVARVYDALGVAGAVELSGPLADGRAETVNLLLEDAGPLAGEPGNWRFQLDPWRIQTIVLSRQSGSES